MEPQEQSLDLSAALAERFATLPSVVQDAITSADVQESLRSLAKTHKLHIDAWQLLENNVLLTLLGFQQTSDLASHLTTDLKLSPEAAQALANDISKIVFEPIRSVMEEKLDHPSTQKATSSQAQAPTPITPATPPPPKGEETAQRAAIPSSYHSTASHERRSIEGDPYREQIS